MNEMPIWQCEFSGQDLGKLTVGTIFDLNCSGDIPVEWKPGENLQITPAKKEEAYSLVVLESKSVSDRKVELRVTGYKPGPHQPEYFRVTQGDRGFEVSRPKWEFQSVRKPNEPDEPHPSYGPFALSLPAWIWLVGLALIIALGLVIWRQARRHLQRRRMLAELSRHRTALPPLHQFYRDLRQLRRRLHQSKASEELKGIGQDLDRDFRLYVLRSFEIPTLEWKDAAVVNDLRRRHRHVHRLAGEILRKTLRELGRQKERPMVLYKDLEQLLNMSLEAAERLDMAKEHAP